MRVACASAFCLSLVLTGCSFSPTTELAPDTGLALRGAVHGGQQPIAGARIYMLAANTTGDAGPGIAASSSNASHSLLSGTGSSDSLGSYVLTDANGQFTITDDYSCTPNTQVYLYSLGGNPGLGTGVNPAAGLIAALGGCPSSGNFLTSTPYIVINEVSTIAAAYAFSGYATDATHVSSSGTALAKVGIKNAFANAANLADLSTGNALATTPNGNGVVPQTTIYTLANALASCVNSNGAVTGPTNPTACYTLFNNATSNGTSTGTIPSDTTTAAINIAHNPGANIAALFSLPTATAPFPQLGAQPNDFTLGIEFSGGGINDPYAIAIDGSGSPWITNNGGTTSSVAQLASNGTPISPSTGYTGGGLTGLFGGIAIDSVGNAWIPNYSGNTVTELSNSGTVLSGASGYTATGLHRPYGIAIDGSDNVWVTSVTSPFNVVELSNAGATLSGASGYTGGSLAAPYSVAIDGTGNAWIVNKNTSTITQFSSTGTVNINAPFTGGGLSTPYSVAVDHSGNVWVANYNGNAIYGNSISEFSNSGTNIGGTNGYIGGGLNLPYSIALDGSGNAWLANSLGNSVSEFSNSGVPITGENGYLGGNINAPDSVAVDGSGNVWVANLYDSTVTELIGVATPVVTPIAVGVKNNALASRP